MKIFGSSCQIWKGGSRHKFRYRSQKIILLSKEKHLVLIQVFYLKL